MVALLTFALLFPQTHLVKATNECTQPTTRNEIDRLLTNEALKQGVPPEVVKAVAFAESKGWKHCDNKGEVLVSGDGGIGIMQVTDHENEYGLDREKLKDIDYNIEKGVYILKQKFKQSNLPKINDHNPAIIENWYFAVMAYNALVPINSPIYKNDKEKVGQVNTGSYQYKVFQALVDNNPGMDLNLVAQHVNVEDLEYVPKGNSEFVRFKKLQYSYDGPFHYSSHRFQVNDLVRLDDKVSRRPEPRTDKKSYTTGFSPGVLTIESTLHTDLTPKDHLTSFNHFGWYEASDGIKGGLSGYVASSYLQPFGKRLSGADRFLTASAIAQEGWDTADTVVLANGSNFPDALSGAPLAYKLNAPILLTSGKKVELNLDTKDRIKQLGAKKVIILGSEAAVSAQVESTLKKEMKLEVERIGGKDRYETAALIAKKLGGKPEKAIITNGSKYPDALAIAPYAAKHGYPILLTKGQDKNNKRYDLNSHTAKLLKELNISTTIALGGESAVSPQAYKALPGATRIAGENRYETTTKIIEELNLSTETLYIARGNDYPDALTGSVLAAKSGSAVLLVKENADEDIINLQKNLLTKKPAHTFIALGGSNVVSNELLASLIIK